MVSENHCTSMQIWRQRMLGQGKESTGLHTLCLPSYVLYMIDTYYTISAMPA